MRETIDQGVAIRTARLARGLTRDVLAVQAGVDERVIGRAEAGGSLDAGQLGAVCERLGLDSGSLVAEEDLQSARPSTRIRRSAERSRLLALGIAYEASLAATLSWAVLDKGYAIQVAAMVAFFSLVGFALAVFVCVMRLTVSDVPGTPPAKVTARVVWAATGAALGSNRERLFAARLVCLPPAGLAVLYVLRQALVEPTLPLVAGGVALALLTGHMLTETVTDTCGALASD